MKRLRIKLHFEKVPELIFILPTIFYVNNYEAGYELFTVAWLYWHWSLFGLINKNEREELCENQ